MSCSRISYCLALLVTLVAAKAQAAIVGTYVDATTSNTALNTNIVTIGSEIDTDNLWYLRTGVGQSDTVLTSQGGLPVGPGEEDSPMLTTTVTGLAAGTYNVYVLYETFTGRPWNVRAAISGNSLVTYDEFNGVDTGISFQSGAIILRQALLGSVVSAGTIAVDIDDAGLMGSFDPENLQDARSWYDGISYQLVPEPSSLTLALYGLGVCALARRRRG